MREFLLGLTKIAGIGGLSVGVFVIIFREVLKKKIFRNLSQKQTYKIIRLMLIFTFSIGVLGLIFSTYIGTISRSTKTVKPLDIIHDGEPFYSVWTPIGKATLIEKTNAYINVTIESKQSVKNKLVKLKIYYSNKPEDVANGNIESVKNNEFVFGINERIEVYLGDLGNFEFLLTNPKYGEGNKLLGIEVKYRKKQQ